MAAKSGNESTGTFGWGVVAGGIALVGAGVLYLTGLIGPAPQPTLENTATDVAVATETDPDQVTPDQQAEPTSETTANVQQPQTLPAPEQDEETDQAETMAPDVAEPADSATAKGALSETADISAPSEPELPPLAAPALDQIFVEPDGNALLSGSAEPGSRLRVLLDGQEIHVFTVDGSGQFAQFVTLPFSGAARGLVVDAELDGRHARSDDYLIAALPKPQAPAEQVAQAEVEATESTPAPARDTANTAESVRTQPGAEDTGAAEPTPDDAADQSDGTDTDVASAAPQDRTEPDEGGQVAVLRSGEEGVELVQAPDAQETGEAGPVALDTIGYSEEGEVQLTGRAQEGAVVRLYLDNQPVTDLTPNQQGRWRGEVEGIEPGIYTLRLDAIDADGTVVSRLETPFKREPIEALRPVAEEGAPENPDASAIRSVTVQKGDTLWAISRERYGEGLLYVKVFEANRTAIRDPDLIYPGQIFNIPE